MTNQERVLFEFAGYVFIHKPELANELNTQIANYINSNNTLNQAEPEPLTNNKQAQEFTSNCCNKPIYYEDFDENPYCTECLGGCEVNE